MATITATLTPFKKSLQSVLAGTPSFLDATITIALLDQTSPVTEDTTVTGNEFLSDLTGAVILSEISVPSPTLTNLLLDGDDSGIDELTDIGSGEVANKILLYQKTGVASTSRLWGIGTLSANISGDNVNDDLQFVNGLINFDG